MTCNFIKKETLTQCFPVNFEKILRTPFLQNNYGRLLLQTTCEKRTMIFPIENKFLNQSRCLGVQS